MDFSRLDDEQLLQLIKACMAEAVSRGSAIAYAANEVYFDASEELKIKAEAAERAAAAEADRRRLELERAAEAEVLAKQRQAAEEKQRRTWAKKAAIVAALLEDPLFEDDQEKGFSINIWAGSDVRVYIQEGTRRGWEIVYYKTGNQYHPPGSITGLADSEDAPRMARFCDVLCSKWNPGLRLHTTDTKTMQPHEVDLKAYRAALKGETANV